MVENRERRDLALAYCSDLSEPALTHCKFVIMFYHEMTRSQTPACMANYHGQSQIHFVSSCSDFILYLAVNRLVLPRALVLSYRWRLDLISTPYSG